MHFWNTSVYSLVTRTLLVHLQVYEGIRDIRKAVLAGKVSLWRCAIQLPCYPVVFC